MTSVNLFKDAYLRVGMSNDLMVRFTVEGLTPNDVIGKDVEFELKISDLENIIKEAKIYEKEVTGGEIEFITELEEIIKKAKH